ncbi:unnamed protein product [Arctia plantaginis]|uniref:15-oxoprostaglandin 13-reductase n=1 Tax=Arctia plantaginis TaxID=874455 RepID=A0A8S1ATE0_ARCPL|nr:unnamed protein product [Arctia plantaginis]
MRLVKYNVIKAFENYLPTLNDFEIAHENVPTLGPGEFLVKAVYISVDPYMRSFAHRRKVPYEQFGFQVGKVVESQNSEYPENVYVVSHSGWREYTVLNGNPDDIFSLKPYQPQIGNLPLSLSLGALGMPGMTAYLGMVEICKPKKGEVVCVTSAAGAVGSIAGQIAKIKGATVIGFAGTDEKVQMLLEELNFDHAFNYKKEKDIMGTIRSTVEGIDCYFDNVGGELAMTILKCMNPEGRVAECGSISTYGKSLANKKPALPGSVKIQSFSFAQWDWSQQSAALQHIRHWIEKGAIKVKESVANGFEVLPDTFIAMLKGDNVGKSLVKV